MEATLNIDKAKQLKEALLTDREKALEEIYAKTYPMVVHYVKLHNGTAEDAKDLLQEAIILMYEKLMQDSLTLTASSSTYLMAICKNLWRMQSRKKNRFTELTLKTDQEIEQEPTEEPLHLSVMAFVEKLGATCKDLLVAFYYHNQRMEQIATQHKYSTTHSATVQKFKCLERLRKSLSSFSMNQFLN